MEYDEVPCPNLLEDKKCGTVLKRNVKFCPECGRRVDPAWFKIVLVTQPSLPTFYICSGLDENNRVCGQEVPISAKFCSECGTKRPKVLPNQQGESNVFDSIVSSFTETSMDSNKTTNLDQQTTTVEPTTADVIPQSTTVKSTSPSLLQSCIPALSDDQIDPIKSISETDEALQKFSVSSVCDIEVKLEEILVSEKQMVKLVTVSENERSDVEVISCALSKLGLQDDSKSQRVDCIESSQNQAVDEGKAQEDQGASNSDVISFLESAQTSVDGSKSYKSENFNEQISSVDEINLNLNVNDELKIDDNPLNYSEFTSPNARSLNIDEKSGLDFENTFYTSVGDQTQQFSLDGVDEEGRVKSPSDENDRTADSYVSADSFIDDLEADAVAGPSSLSNTGEPEDDSEKKESENQDVNPIQNLQIESDDHNEIIMGIEATNREGNGESENETSEVLESIKSSTCTQLETDSDTISSLKHETQKEDGLDAGQLQNLPADGDDEATVEAEIAMKEVNSILESETSQSGGESSSDTLVCSTQVQNDGDDDAKTEVETAIEESKTSQVGGEGSSESVTCSTQVQSEPFDDSEIKISDVDDKNSKLEPKHNESETAKKDDDRVQNEAKQTSEESADEGDEETLEKPNETNGDEVKRRRARIEQNDSFSLRSTTDNSNRSKQDEDTNKNANALLIQSENDPLRQITRTDYTVLPPKKQRDDINTENKKSKSTRSTAESRKILVHFHVVFSKNEFDFKTNHDYVFMRFGLDKLGGWKSNEWLLKPEKEIDDKYVLLQCDVPIEKEFLFYDRSIPYKYVVHHEKSGKTEYEFVHRMPDYPDQIPNRFLWVPKERLMKSAEWHQYDGVMCKKPDDETAKFFSFSNLKDKFSKLTGRYYNKILKRTKMAATAMLPSWDDLRLCREEQGVGDKLLEKLDQVQFCVKNCFLNENAKPDESKMKEVLKDFVDSAVSTFPQDDGMQLQMPWDSCTNLAAACCVVYILMQHKVTVDKNAKKCICRALLIRVGKESNLCTDYKRFSDVFFTESWMQRITAALLEFLDSLVTREFVEPMWLFAVPLLHFLTRESSPYEPLKTEYKHTERSGKWWGITKIKELVENYKRLNKSSMPLDAYVDHLGPLFTMDKLLPRTVLSVMSLQHIPQLVESAIFPLDACLANAYYFINSGCSESEEKEIILILGKVLFLMQTFLQDVDSSKADTLLNKKTDLLVLFKIADDLLELFLKKYNNLQKYLLGIQIIQINAAVISSMQKLQDLGMNIDEWKTSDDSSNIQQMIKQNLNDLIRKVRTWLYNVLPPLMVQHSYWQTSLLAHYASGYWEEKEFMTYSHLAEVKFEKEEYSAVWKAELNKVITERLRKLSPHDRIQIFVEINFSKLSPDIEECFSKSAFDVLENSSHDKYGDMSFVFEASNKCDDAVKIRGLLSRWFEKSWPGTEDDMTILRHILTWPSFPRFLGVFYGRTTLESLLTERCVDFILIAVSMFEDILRKLMHGSLTVKQLQLVLDEKGRLLEVLNVIETSTKSGIECVPDAKVEGMNKQSVILKVLEWRKSELEKFMAIRLLVQHFITMCDSFNSDDVEELINKFKLDYSDMPLNEICGPRFYSPDLAMEETKYNPKVKFFNITESYGMIKRLAEVQDSVIFKEMWNKSISKATQTNPKVSLDMRTIGSHIWTPSWRQWGNFVVEVRDGSISFRSIDRKFGVFKSSYDQMQKELELICENKALALERLNQIKQYHQLNQYSEGATVMLELRDMFHLEGDFKMVEVLVDLVKDRTQTLEVITKELVESGKQLLEINETKVKCLRGFLKEEKFAHWLKTSLSGPKEVKVLVDLAMISAEGQGDYEVHKVSCLHAAATGYSPLIYDLQPHMGFLEFLPLCQAVWRSLDVDPELPKKFRDSARQLEWLNRVKESHGSVEVSALASAEAINNKGIYTVGNLQHENTTKTLDSIIQLKLHLKRGDHDIEDEKRQDKLLEEKWQTLNLQQLNDLQSKLMLVAGKAQEGKKEVDTFVEVLDGITRLGNLYIKICNAGCSLFQNWRAIFFCELQKPMCVRVEFGKDNKHVLIGKKTPGEENVVQEHIRVLCEFMEKCLKDWQDHLEKERRKSFFLNHFTTEQIVILQNELAKINTAEKNSISKRIYPLLSLIKPNCTLRQLEEAMYSAFKQLAEAEERRNPPTEEEDETEESENAEENDTQTDVNKELTETFLQKMIDSNFSEKLAYAAAKAVGIENVEEGIMWCMEHEGDVPDENEEEEEENEGTDVDVGMAVDEPTLKPVSYSGLHLGTTKDTMTTDLFKNLTGRNKSSLESQLHDLWTVFQSEMNTSVADYLSVQHLALMLYNLTKTGAEKLDRKLPDGMNKGRPNLVVCAQADVLSIVLSIYMHGRGESLPLPGIDEVLMCNSETTAEDVELLWRRAEGDARREYSDRYGKIYCLVHAELLDYDIARRAEQSLEMHSHEASELQLVVVCCREQEDRSHMINALDRFRVKFSNADLHEVQSYLKRHLTNKASENVGVRSAAVLDPERCYIRVIKSHRAGVGKTLKVKRLLENLNERKLSPKDYTDSLLISIPLHSRAVNQSAVVDTLLSHTLEPHLIVPRIFHIDISHEVHSGIDYLLFNLLVLGGITNREGYVWRRSSTDLYVIETMPLLQREQKPLDKRQQTIQYVHQILHLLPTITCWSPTDSLELLRGNKNVKDRYTNGVLTDYDQQMDQVEFRSPMFQRPFQYLQRFVHNQELRGIQADVPQGTPAECIQALLEHCGIRDPSWSELRHFVNFLNFQLRACENSIFCGPLLAQDLPGFLNFVVRFMMHMSKDFATRSLNISEETPEVAERLLNPNENEGDDILGQYGLKRRWETSPHPYLFFNADQTSFTFMGFIINPVTGDILEPRTNRVLAPNVLPRQLHDALTRNRVNLSENFDVLPRDQKIMKMCNIMGIDMVHDPDETYELTADNVKKMLAIYMRFRCDIPVIVMGETGCGKTRLVKFLCDLWKPPGSPINNMVLMKVHGGTSANSIVDKVTQAAKLAIENQDEYPQFGIETVLFFDEANTTEAIGTIKEIMCDHTIQGKPLRHLNRLKLIAACNPYRKHSNEMIQRLEHSGLGYHVQANQTTDKLGRIPMRQLVYRVQSLPQSMLPLVWDFGQLSTEVETLYIRQMVHRYIQELQIKEIPRLEETVSDILAASQEFMRLQKDESSFVSLRDVDRTLRIMTWFFPRKDIFHRMNDIIADTMEHNVPQNAEDDDEDQELVYRPPDDLTRSLILALGVCYHACLQNREAYRQHIAPHFQDPCALENGDETILEDITCCQDVFLSEVDLGENIARNQALKENLFMMVVCIELRIPLFLVGKPGSSKSLAKTIVADAMQGEAARSEIFRSLKSVHMVSYQCSPLSTPEGIVGTFRQCAKLQEGQDLNKFVSVVVLDEVGLAEDSDRMPLKTLHPLLEDGCEGEEEPLPHKKVGFIGISNWALDPAKMNRGILVQRGVPDEQELEQSAKGICASDKLISNRIDSLVKSLAKAYLELYNSALEIREFYGLRDFYSLIKMICAFAKKSKKKPTWYELQHAILRNFGGMDNVRPVDVFAKHLDTVVVTNQRPRETDPTCDPASLIRASLSGDGLDSESRYLLILTENYAALGLLQHELLRIRDAITIFGSSFPKDQEYTQVCRNINRIKVCMETGRTVVLLNLENLYESLYDALNQYYVKFGDQRFVDLGLGTQRVKCRVHQSFRLIVVAEKQIVYEKFPIPLINRLEKHFLAMSTMLTDDQIQITEKLTQWAKDFATPIGVASFSQPGLKNRPKVGDVFIGYHPDTAASVVLQVCQLDESRHHIDQDQVFELAKNVLLQCATPEAIVRLSNTKLAATSEQLWNQYFVEQKHENLLEFLKKIIIEDQPTENIFAQVTTHSRLLLPSEAEHIAKELRLKRSDISVQALHAFGTEQQFCRMLKDFFCETSVRNRVLMIQCDSGDVHADLIACARYNIWNEYSQTRNIQRMPAGEIPVLEECSGRPPLIHIIFVIQLPRIAGGCFVGFQGGKWLSYHIDDLHPSTDKLPSLAALKGHSVSSLFEHAHVSSVNLNNSNDERVERSDFEQEVASNNESKDEEMEVEVGPEVSNAKDEDVVTRARRRDASEVLKCARNAMERDDVDGIIRTCLHGATAMLKDPAREEALKQRKTYRLQLLLKLLDADLESETIKVPLVDLLRKRITLLLKDKEETAMSTTIANSWLSYEAASFDSVCRCGTLRRSLWNYLENRVTPLLAYIIAFCDVNANLDLLDQEENWIRSMWMAMFDNPEVTDIKYRDLQTVTQRNELNEFEVKVTGHQDSFFKSCLPFSWIIKKQIDRLIFITSQQIGNEDTEARVERVLMSSCLGKILNQAYEEAGGRRYVVNQYLSDYVCMVYKPQSKDTRQEYELIGKDLERATGHRHRQHGSSEDDVEPRIVEEPEITIINIHLTFASVHHRYQLFSELVQIYPQCVDILSRNKSTDMTLDLKSLYMLLEYMAPTRNELDNVNSRCAWMDKIRNFSPIIHRLMECVGKDLIADMKEHFDHCRFMWNRVNALELFIEHVCPSDGKDEKLSIKRCMPLWNMLGEKADFKTVKSLEIVENFLKICNSTASETYFGKGAKCGSCEKPACLPVELPCKHIICKDCFEELKGIQIHECPECKKAFSEDFKPEVIKTKKLAAELYNKYKHHCNTFFMDLVSRLCFSGNTPPDGDVVKKLLGYVTPRSKLAEKLGQSGAQTRTKKMGFFEDGIDPTPVVRSFLLQLLLRSDVHQVYEYLEQYFEGAQAFVQSEPDQIVELCVLCIQCLEDYFQNEGLQMDNCIERSHSIRQSLQRVQETLFADKFLNVQKLIAIARMKHGLSEVADCLFRLYIKQDLEEKTLKAEMGKLRDAGRQLCDQERMRWPRIYLLKQILRRFGHDALMQLSAEPTCAWLIPREARQNENDAIPDRFVICGNDYKMIREAVTQSLLSKKWDQLKDRINNLEGSDEVKERQILLAIYREVTAAFAHRDNLRRPQAQDLNQLTDLTANSAMIIHKDLANSIINNTLGDVLLVTPDQARIDRGIAEVIVHFLIVLRNARDNQLHQPFIELLNNPANMQQSFLPTMPQDDLDEIRAALNLTRNQNENTTFYQCPNGHPYVIGNCGRPAFMAACIQCGAQIGGQSYRLVAGNAELTANTDQTRPGHILGPAQPRPPMPERAMTSAQTAILRMLLHMSMYLGSLRNPQAISQIIQPVLQITQVGPFLWDHIRADLNTIQTAVGKSQDDVLLLMHLLIDRMIRSQVNVACGDGRLSTKQARQQWEANYVNNYIAQTLQNLNDHLQTANNEMVDDNRLGNNPLLRLLYEVDASEVVTNVNSIQDVPAIWRYRSRISLEHLSLELQQMGRATKGKKQHPYPILHLFLEEERQLRAIRLLPNILKLHRLLLSRFNRSIDSSEASTTRIATFLENLDDDHSRAEYRNLIDDFFAVWECIRHSLQNYTFGRMTCPEEFTREPLTRDSRLAVLLPYLRGWGLCSVALVHYLHDKQNNFLETYSKGKQSLQEIVGVNDASFAHLVAYDPDRDLQPIILANCNYSLEVGKGTKVEYDFGSMEKQIIKRFIRGRPRLGFQMDFILFREDFTNAVVFTQLRTRIPQVPLSVQNEIEKDLRQKLIEIGDLLASLNIAVEFLVYVDVDPEQSIMKFMSETLKMKTKVASNAVHSCKIKHVESLWLLLSFMRARMQASYGQDPFENVDEKYRALIPQPVQDKLRLGLQHINMDLFLPLLYECIIFEMTVKHKPEANEDEVDNSRYPLKDVLLEYINQKSTVDPIQALEDGRFPDDLLVAQCISTWLLALNPNKRHPTPPVDE